MSRKHSETYDPINSQSIGVSYVAMVRSAVSYDTSARNDGTQVADRTLGIAHTESVVKKCRPSRFRLDEENLVGWSGKRLQSLQDF